MFTVCKSEKLMGDLDYIRNLEEARLLEKNKEDYRSVLNSSVVYVFLSSMINFSLKRHISEL